MVAIPPGSTRSFPFAEQYTDFAEQYQTYLDNIPLVLFRQEQYLLFLINHKFHLLCHTNEFQNPFREIRI